MLLFILEELGFWLLFRHSNTSHVTLYQVESAISGYNWEFKYISCYSLSHSVLSCCRTGTIQIHLMLLFITVDTRNKHHKLEFKYISCYSLSIHIPMLRSPLLQFKYISCYSLSFFCILFRLFFLHSNTSHVTLYLVPFTLFLFFFRIQIHLMLLFICFD